jgi:hypothetical protein
MADNSFCNKIKHMQNAMEIENMWIFFVYEPLDGVFKTLIEYNHQKAKKNDIVWKLTQCLILIAGFTFQISASDPT